MANVIGGESGFAKIDNHVVEGRFRTGVEERDAILGLNRGRQCIALPIQQKWLSGNRLKCAFCFHPCPCGWFGDSEKSCTCSASVVARYQKRISGPLLDRIDIYLNIAYQWPASLKRMSR